MIGRIVGILLLCALDAAPLFAPVASVIAVVSSEISSDGLILWQNRYSNESLERIGAESCGRNKNLTKYQKKSAANMGRQIHHQLWNGKGTLL